MVFVGETYLHHPNLFSTGVVSYYNCLVINTFNEGPS